MPIRNTSANETVAICVGSNPARVRPPNVRELRWGVRNRRTVALAADERRGKVLGSTVQHITFTSHCLPECRDMLLQLHEHGETSVHRPRRKFEPALQSGLVRVA